MARETKNSQHQRPTRPPGRRSGFSLTQLPLGWLLLGVLFLYLVVSVFIYMNNSRIASYQVTSGTLSRNETYTALALREESVNYASSGGYLNYYAREGNRINANGIVYSISSSQNSSGEVQLSKEELNRIRSQMSGFSNNYNPASFNAAYGFKYQLEGSILQYAADRSGSGQGGSMVYGAQSVYRSATDGIVLYCLDGYEGKTLSNLTEADLNPTAYMEKNLKTKEMINAGDPVYTIVTDENWDLVIPLTEKQATALAGRTAIRVKFLQDGMTQNGDFEILYVGSLRCAHIHFDKGMLRYASERFLDVELVTNTEIGLRIPRTAILERDFYIIPAEFATYTEDKKTGFWKLNTSRGKETSDFVETTIYGSDQKEKDEELEAGQSPTYLYYVDKSLFDIGDTVVDPDTNRTYTISSSRTLDGVYCINKGYAVFRRVEIIEKNEEFAIADTNTAYGLIRYDHIALDCSNVSEEDILY